MPRGLQVSTFTKSLLCFYFRNFYLYISLKLFHEMFPPLVFFPSFLSFLMLYILSYSHLKLPKFLTWILIIMYARVWMNIKITTDLHTTPESTQNSGTNIVHLPTMSPFSLLQEEAAKLRNYYLYFFSI